MSLVSLLPSHPTCAEFLLRGIIIVIIIIIIIIIVIIIIHGNIQVAVLKAFIEFQLLAFTCTVSSAVTHLFVNANWL